MRIPFFNHEEKREFRHPQPAVFPDMRGAQIAGMYRGARKGGDFYDIVATANSRRVLFLLMDIAGKREEAFHIAAHVQETFRAEVPDLFEHHDINEAEVLTDLLLTLNRKILDVTGTAHFSPAFIGCYAQDYGTLCYINAGHTPALLVDSGGCTELVANGLPLGLFSHAMHDAQMAVLEPGAALLLVSRGLVEMKQRSHEFGIAGVKAALADIKFDNAPQLCAAVLERAQAFANHAELVNDVTTLALVRASAAKVATRNA